MRWGRGPRGHSPARRSAAFTRRRRFAASRFASASRARSSRSVSVVRLLSSSLVGALVVVLGLLQIVVIAAALYGFNQNWHVEEERPIGSGEDYGAGASPADGTPQPA